ncbi:MAG: putative glycerol kinase [Planctomycetota bacterium]|jgi:glycerol kinase
MGDTPRHILALDCGTTSVRAIVFAVQPEGGAAEIGTGQREFAQHFPKPGWVEHDADEIWTALLACVKDALAAAKRSASEIAAIGITNQRETIVVWDRATGKPIHRAIVWQDRRTASRLVELRAEGHEDAVRAATGLTLDPYFSATKLAWILDAVPGARARAEAGELAAGTIDSWVLWKLTNGRVHATDASNASRTLLARIGGAAGCAWDDALCSIFRVPRAVLPEIRDSAGAFGASDAALLGAAIPVTGIAGDQQSALFGQSCFTPGDAKCTFGTGCFLLANAGTAPPPAPNGLLTTVAWRIGGQTTYAIEGSVFVGGSAVQWLRDGLSFFEKSREVNALAASVADSGGVVVVPAFAGLGAPWWDADARGAVLGLTRGSTKAHISRATLEGIAHQVADLVEAIEAGGVLVHALRVDGGAAASDLLMQFEADFLGKSVVRPRILETTALGAAQLAVAGLSTASAADALKHGAGDVDRTFAPAATPAARSAARARWRRAVDTVRAFGNPAD